MTEEDPNNLSLRMIYDQIARRHIERALGPIPQWIHDGFEKLDKEQK